MNSVVWGELYNQFKNTKLNPAKLEGEIKELIQDDDVTKKSGIYSYVLTRQEGHLSIRAFTDKMKREAYERQSGICPFCKKQKKKETVGYFGNGSRPHYPLARRRKNYR